MLKSYIYFPDDLDKEINQIAKSQKKSKAEVVREATAKGVKVMKQETNSGLEAFRKLAEIGKKSASNAREMGPLIMITTYGVCPKKILKSSRDSYS